MLSSKATPQTERWRPLHSGCSGRGVLGAPPPTLTRPQAASEEPSVGPTTADRQDCPEPSQHRTQQETLGNRRAYDRATPPNTPTPKRCSKRPSSQRGCALPNTCTDNAERQLQDHQGPRAEAWKRRSPLPGLNTNKGTRRFRSISGSSSARRVRGATS